MTLLVVALVLPRLYAQEELIPPPRVIEMPLPVIKRPPIYQRVFSTLGRGLIWPIVRWPDCPEPPGDAAAATGCYTVSATGGPVALALNNPTIKAVYRGRRKLEPGRDYWITLHRQGTVYLLYVAEWRDGQTFKVVSAKLGGR